MFSYRINLFKLFGFSVRLDISWIIIAFLVTWSLALGVFPAYSPGLTASTYWWMGVIGALGLFLSIIIHEFSHSIIARNFGMPMKGITLFIFGGVAEMEDEPPSAKSEFFMAIAGPIASVTLGFIFYGFHAAGVGQAWPEPMVGVLGYLGWINWVLAAFNLVPAFPLDGGRILRSALWQWKKDIRWSTRISSRLGSAFGFFLCFLGVLSIFSGMLIGGLWWILIGLFLNNASQMSYQRMLITQSLEGERVSRFMKIDPVTVQDNMPLNEFIQNYLYRYYYKMFPVVANGVLKGCITTKEIKSIPRKQWDMLTVGEVAIPCSSENAIGSDDDATRALSKMNATGNGRLIVVDRNRLVGVITLKDLLKFLSMKLDLENSQLPNTALLENDLINDEKHLQQTAKD